MRPPREPGPARGHGAGSTARRRARRRARRPTSRAATDAAARSLRVQPQIRALRRALVERARIQVDVVTGRAPLGGGQWLFDALAVPGIGDMLAINPGVEGIGATHRRPHRADPAARARDGEAAVDEAAVRCDARLRDGRRSRSGSRRRCVARADRASRSTADQLYPVPHRHVRRGPRDARGPPLPAVCAACRRRRALSAAALREAALDGAHYLVAHLAPNGRYIYEHDLATGVQTDPMHSSSYSMPRHGGTTYFLASSIGSRRSRGCASRSSARSRTSPSCSRRATAAARCPTARAFDCVLDKDENTAQLGSTALVVVALAEYQRATGDTRYLPLAQKLAAWLLYMQRPDGSFRHLYDPRAKKPDEHAELLYYSGEASLALARMYVITGDARTRRRPSAGSTGSSTGTTSSWAASSTARSTGRASPPRRSGRR